ncbi:MAG: hypothetical protein LBM98_01255 [Oscillospiraceae bacterium]|nr:hypothetical protein [Oscillospiraceae bacterium]
MRYVGRYRCEAIQCRSPQIRMVCSRHWIASPLYWLRIASFARLRNDGLLSGYRLTVPRRSPLAPRTPRPAPLPPHLVHRTPHPTSNPYPLCGGVAPQSRGGSPPQRTYPRAGLKPVPTSSYIRNTL